MRLAWVLLTVLPAFAMEYRVDPVTRYIHFTYHVPPSAPALIDVRGEYHSCASAEWLPASVWPYMSETAQNLISAKEWEEGTLAGRTTERSAAGLDRTLVWNPAVLGATKACVAFRVTLSASSKVIALAERQIQIDNSDVVMLQDWSKVVQQEAVAENPAPGAPVWWLRKSPRGTALKVKEKGVELPQLTYPLNLSGFYAVFVALPAKLGAIELRLTGDERAEFISSRHAGRETFWRWTDMTRQHLVVHQPYRTVFEYEDNYRAELDAVRLVPLSRSLVAELNANWSRGKDRRLLAGYNEPYSWAFYEKVLTTAQHWEPLSAFAQAGVDLVDIQFGRGGSTMQFESRAGTQLLGRTHGDPVRGKIPNTPNVGRMQQYTNMLETQLRYARMLGMKPYANLGATNCYPGTALESAFSKLHPEWREGSTLKYEVPEVRRYILALMEEVLQIGAEGISIDWCRYPNSVHHQETVTTFFRELRALADRCGKRRGIHIDILTRFPARGVRGWEYMDYGTWAREGLVDLMAPSNIQGRHLTFDIAEYQKAVRGTRVKLLPCVDGLGWGLPIPGLFLDRILQMYERGTPGVYIYQCDGPVLASPETRRHIAIAGAVDSLRRWRERERREQPRYSKGIYLNQPEHGPKYHAWERIRPWVEGFAPGKVELWLDGKLLNRYDAPPYVLTSEERSDDKTIAVGAQLLKIRAFDGRAWMEQEFPFEYAQ